MWERLLRSASRRGFVTLVVAVVLGATLFAVAGTPADAGARTQTLTYAEIKEYRQREGLDLDLAGHPKEIAARIRGLLTAWRAGEKWARRTASIWGAPLRPADLKLKKFRQTVLNRWNKKFEPWLARHPQADATYAGYYANPESGGWIYIGFTAEEDAWVARMKRDLDLTGPGLLRPFPYQPAHTEAELSALEESLTQDESLWNLMNSVGIETEQNKVSVSTEHVAKLRTILAERFGADAPIEVEYGGPIELL